MKNEWSQRIVRLRLEKGWSQAILAKQVGSDVKSIRRWEKGERTPQPFYRQKLAEVFGVTQVYLGFLPEEPQSENQSHNLTLQTSEKLAYDEQTPETDWPTNTMLNANLTDLSPTTETEIEPYYSRLLRQRCILWLFFLLMAIIGIGLAGTVYLLVVHPYLLFIQWFLQGLKH